MNDVLFQHEGSVVLLLGVIVFSILYVRLAKYKKRVWDEYYLSENIPKGFLETHWFAFFSRVLCLIVSWTLLSIAFMGPTSKVQDHMQIASRAENVDEIVFILDASASMKAQDTSIGESRFDRAKEMITAIVEKLAGINVSLMVFSGNEELLVPPTTDYLYFRILLDSARINEPGITGTDFYSLVEAIQKSVKQASFSKSTLFVLISDGEDPEFLDLSKEGQVKAEGLLLAKVADTVSKECVWDVIGIGTEKGARIPGVTDSGSEVVSKLQRPFLQAIAKAGHGRYYEENEGSLLAIVDNIVADAALEQKAAQTTQVFGKEAVIPLIASFIFMLAALFLPQARKKR